jgi:hypothetical protein
MTGLSRLQTGHHAAYAQDTLPYRPPRRLWRSDKVFRAGMIPAADAGLGGNHQVPKAARRARPGAGPGRIECQAGYRPARDTELCPLPRWRPPRPWVLPTA